MTKKIKVYGISIILCIISLFFLFNSLEKIFFNEKYYHTPNLIGMHVEDAKKLLNKNNLHLEIVSEEFSRYEVGQIFIQNPEADNIIKKNRHIKVWVSKGSEIVDMPNLVGISFEEAKALCESNGLHVGKVASTRINRPYNEVIAISPDNNTIRRGDTISFLISGSEALTEIVLPNLVGMHIEEAKSLLEDNSLNIGKITKEKHENLPDEQVIATSIVAGVKVKLGTSVNIIVNENPNMKMELEKQGEEN